MPAAALVLLVLHGGEDSRGCATGAWLEEVTRSRVRSLRHSHRALPAACRWCDGVGRPGRDNHSSVGLQGIQRGCLSLQVSEPSSPRALSMQGAEHLSAVTSSYT